jgi:Tc toxin complex TcA C-terminal TcB-binding domain/Neuraminidase-like domain/Salmonella virulence plasmid 28.1kDa A protein
MSKQKPDRSSTRRKISKATKQNSYRILGRVSDRTTRQGVPGLKVEAWDKEKIVPNPVGFTTTKEQGAFQIEFTASFFEQLFLRREPDLFFKIFRGEELIKSTENSVLWNVKAGETKVEIEVDLPAVDPPKTFLVQGKVGDVDGSPAVGVLVRAFNKNLRSEQLLGEATTDKAGEYAIRYPDQKLRRAERGSADLVVKALARGGSLLAASPVVFNAGPVETINLLIGGTVLLGPSEYTRIAADVEPLLDGVAVADLTETDLEFLSGETDWSREFLGFYAVAARLSKQTKLPTEVFYGFAREKLPTTLNLLLAQSADTQRRALESAINEKIIPAGIGPTIDSVLNSLKKLVVQQAFADPSEPGKTSVGALIGTSLANPAERTEIVTRYVNHTGTIEEFWDGLRKDPVYAAKVDDLQFTLQLGALTANHLPLVKALQEMRMKKEFQDLRDLVRLEVADWKTMLTGRNGTPGTGFPPEVRGADDAERATNYATILTRMIRDAFRTAAVAHAVSRDNIPGKADLISFFTNNVAFDLGTTHIDTYLADNAGTALAGVSDPAALTQQLKSFQRVHRLAPEYEQMRDLLGENLHSAQAISQIGEIAFVNQFGPAWGANQAQLVFANAAQTATTALMLLGEYGAAFNSLGVAVLGTNGEPPAGIPNLENLFGSLDLCDCEHCRSVLSPAAYLVDILVFLKNRKSTIAGKSAKDILFQRRPDLGQIELTCENTNTPLPYVDLVNELLEDCVAPPKDPVARQTTGTVAELMANPQFLNQAAYDKLQSEVFPWSLPFDLVFEEVHAYLEHLGVPRHELMRTFQKPGTPPDPTDAAIAADYLGLGPADRQIISGMLNSSRKPWEFWGYPAASPGAWLTELRTVRLFLDKSGLSYAELVELLKTRFINSKPADPNLGIVIVSTDPLDPGTCDTEKLRIANAGNNLPDSVLQSFLDRVHKFVRLWHRLGWTARELDKAISVLQIGRPSDAGFDDVFLVNLSHIERLRRDFKLSVEQLLALWAPIDVAGEGSTYQKLFQNPAVLKPVDPAFDLNLNGTELAIASTGANISDHAATILAALGISAADLAALTAIEATDGLLNLANLSQLYRVSLLAKGVKLSIQDTLTLRALTDVDPFDSINTGGTVRFAELAAKVRMSGFSLAELDYLLRHKFPSFSAIPPAEASIAAALDEIRQGLQKINGEIALTPDPTGDITRQKLASLEWNSPIIEEAITTLNDAVVYETNLATLPGGVDFPTALQNKISYDNAARVLRFRGAMTEPDKISLLGLSSVRPYQNAVQSLFEAPRTFVITQMRAFDIPSFPAPLSVLPPIVFPDEFRGRISYDSSAKQLRFVGFMMSRERTILLNLSTDVLYQAAINALFAASGGFVPEPENAFLTPVDVSLLFDVPTTPADRFQIVLARSLVRLRSSLIKQNLSDALKLDTNIIEQLLTRRINSPAHPPDKSLSDFLAPAFAESDLQVKLTAIDFPDQFQSFTLLHKAAMVLTKFRVTMKELTWLFDYVPGIDWLDLNALPTIWPNSASPRTLFADWARLADLFQLRDQLPLGESVLSEVFSAARATAPDHDALLARLSVGAPWDLHDLKFLDGITGFNLSFPSAYQDESGLVRLRECFVLMKRLGASAEKCFAWAKADLTPDDAASVKQTAKAKYDDEQWLAIARPLRDVVREKQRSSLVAYLVAHPNPARGQTWKDANGMFDYFLVDVEMSPCQLTSRIKQAIGSVQLFVQRCLLNLEPSVPTKAQSDAHWLEWKWMNNYRVWEANRKIFLYPENWIEPDLRDGKSPFFKDLENDLLQNEVTLETVESALLTYVEKLDGVAHLEIVGMYDQQEQDARGNRVVDILHVFGRTRSSPHHYHYRQRVDSAYWTPWERVDLDIEGDHLIPVVWNRRLCVFWPIFTEKSRAATWLGATSADTVKFWEIQIAWSEFKNKKWTAKRISKAVVEPPNSIYTVVHDTGQDDIRVIFEDSRSRPKEDFTFRTLLTNGDLAIRIYCHSNRMQNSVSTFTTIDSVVLHFKESVDWFFEHVSWAPHRPFAEFSFTGCNSEPEVILKSALINVTPLVVPLGSIPNNMEFVDFGGAIQESHLTLLEGNFPISVTSSSEGTFESSRLNILTLNKTPGTFNLLTAHQDRQFTAQRPFFFQDDRRAFLVLPEQPLGLNWSQPNEVGLESVAPIQFYYQQPVPVPDPVIPPVPGDLIVAEPSQEVDLVASSAVQLGQVGILAFNRPPKRYRFKPFYHPYVCPLLRELNRNGIDGLLQRPAQITPHLFLVPPQVFDFDATYQPEPVVAHPHPFEDVDFSYSGAYSSYNWELFFHVPLLIADRLSKNQRFEDAQKWFHYIFDPTDTSGYSAPQKFWRTKRFFQTTTAQYRNEQIQQMLQRLAAGNPDPETDDQIKQWRQHPFNPHLIARLRTTAYQKSTVMKYLDNLIAWGDQLFSRDTIETINEATQLYILAADILGRRPENIKPRITPPARTFNTLEPLLDDFSNALVQVENVVSVVPSSRTSGAVVVTPPPFVLSSTLYFCVPKNDKLLGYWDTVADRLFKIRHCMNIEGVVRQLPLFEPPIDPALLVRAAAAGLDISSALNDINAALPHYRFNVMAQKTGEVCAELKALGGSLLAALEKRDAEAVALLRSAQELKVLDAVRQVRQRQVDEARETLEAAKKSREVVVIRHDYYANIQFLNIGEKAHLALSGSALILQSVQAQMDLVASFSALIPNFKAGFLTTLGTTFGGDNLHKALQAVSSYIGATANILHTGAGLSSTLGGYQRRDDDWKLQERLASKELEQFDRQILAAEIRLAIAELELRNHDLQVENAKEMDVFLHDKFTNRELYDWMVSQISGIYFQSYQLTYGLAKRAERAYRFELGLTDSNFIQFGYWDSLRKGLLAGERLSHDLKRMEADYLDLNRREYELTKQISLLLIDPAALVRLKETGECFVELPEELFDLDFPGHYLRRIKSMSLTIPCVTGPYTGVNCTLSLLRSSVRHDSTLLADKYERQEGDPRFIDNIGAIQSIVTSSAQNDSGMFEANLRDERYLFFEGAGAISQWRIELPKGSNQFDFDTIADVVLQLKYTAREGGEALRSAAQDALSTPSGSLVRLFSMKHEFPTEWHRFLHPPEAQIDQSVTLDLTQDRFPFQFQSKTIKVSQVELFLKVNNTLSYTTLKIFFQPTPPLSTDGIDVVKDTILNDLPHGTKTFTPNNESLGPWTLLVKENDILQATSLRLQVNSHTRLNPESIEDLWILCHYIVT